MAVPALPLCPNVVELFTVSLARRVGHDSIKVYLCGVQFYSIMAGFPQLIADMTKLQYVLRGIKMSQRNDFRRSNRAPVTIAQLRRILLNIRSNYPARDAHTLISAILLAFFGLLRVSEYTSKWVSRYEEDATLMISDISVDMSNRIIHVHIKVSKTDPFRQGVTIRISATNNDLCPFTALTSFLQVRGSAFGPLFTFGNNSYLTRNHVTRLLKSNFPESCVNTHSLRKGGASALAALGVPDYVIQLLGRWKSDAYRKYINFPDAFITAANSAMANHQ
jgi:hypothetical protein